MATFNQFNLPGQLTEIGITLDFHDINGDGIMDIFVCTEKGDSLYLNIIDDLYGHPTKHREYFLDLINQYNDNGDYLFVDGELSDLTRDGYPEYVFAVNGGHSLQPRRVYAIDYRTDTLLMSPISGAAITSIDLFDIDRDGADEIMLNTVAPENFKTTIPYRDSITWLMVLNEDLTFYRSPVPKNPPPSWLSMEPFVEKNKHYLMTYHRYRSGEGYDAELSIYDQELKPVRSRIITNQRYNRLYLWRTPGKLGIQDVKFFGNSGVYTTNLDLEFNDSLFNNTPFGYGAEVQLDVDDDGDEEYVFLSLKGIYVFRSDLSESASVEVNREERNPRTLICKIERPDTYPVLFVQVGTERYWMNYRLNRWFQYRGLAYPGIYILLFGFLYFWISIQNRIVSQRYEKDRLISTLRLQSIKNQLDPHFTYNALNAVGSLIYKEEKDLAYQYLKGLTDLLRMVAGDAAEITWKLSDELQFVKKYLEIEKLRFREKFNYSIDVEKESLNESQIPKMSVLTFVENSIKHGLKQKQDERRLDITVESLSEGLKIGIRDNGVGRAAAAKNAEESAGNGINMMKIYFKQFEKATRKRARFEVTDLFEYDLKASGTLVEIIIT
jgi:hypothetical protein